VEKGMVSTDLKNQEPGWLVNHKKGYKIKIFKLFKLVNALNLDVGKTSEEADAFVKFNDVTKGLVYRALQTDK